MTFSTEAACTEKKNIMLKTRLTKRRERRGGAMLELALLLPIYMLIFFAVWTMGDVGLVSSQVHLASRYAAWRRAPQSQAHVAERVGGGTLRAKLVTGQGAGIVAAGYAHLPNNKYTSASGMTYWHQHSAPELFSYPVWDSLESPLINTGRAVGSTVDEDDEPDYKSVLSSHDGHFMTSSGYTDKFPSANTGNNKDVAYLKYNSSMLAAALEGDYSYGKNMPWLQRKVATAAVSMRGVAGITSRRNFVSTHTVLLGARYHTMIPDYYSKVGSGESLAENNYLLYHHRVAHDSDSTMQYDSSRDARAYKYIVSDSSLTEGGKYHQLHRIAAREKLSPPF